MKKIRIHGVALSLFIIASAFYLLGLFGAAIGLSIIGVMFEVAAWISLFDKESK